MSLNDFFIDFNWGHEHLEPFTLSEKIITKKKIKTIFLFHTDMLFLLLLLLICMFSANKNHCFNWEKKFLL